MRGIESPAAYRAAVSARTGRRWSRSKPLPCAVMPDGRALRMRRHMKADVSRSARMIRRIFERQQSVPR